MSDCLIHPNTPEKWIAYMQDSLARILASPGIKQELAKKREVASTVKSSASLAWFNQDTCSWKMSQQSFLTDSEPSSIIWPRSGMTRNGYAYELPIVGRRTIGIDGGYWPTPRSCSAMAATITPESAWKNSRFPNLETVVGMRMWPTPTAHDAKDTGTAPSEGRRNTPNLAYQTGGKLNPQWVEWLMGFPIGFSASKDWVTRKSLSKQR